MSAHQKGFHIVEMIIVIVLVGLVGFIGWRVWSQNGTNNTQAATTQSSTQIKSATDVTKASQTLDDPSFDSNLDPSQLDADISSVL